MFMKFSPTCAVVPPMSRKTRNRAVFPKKSWQVLFILPDELNLQNDCSSPVPALPQHMELKVTESQQKKPDV